jgi:hypothetical protein
LTCGHVRLVVLCLSGIWRLLSNLCPAPLGWPGLLGSRFGCYLERLTLQTVRFWKDLVYHRDTRLKLVFNRVNQSWNPLILSTEAGGSVLERPWIHPISKSTKSQCFCTAKNAFMTRLLPLLLSIFQKGYNTTARLHNHHLTFFGGHVVPPKYGIYVS